MRRHALLFALVAVVAACGGRPTTQAAPPTTVSPPSPATTSPASTSSTIARQGPRIIEIADTAGPSLETSTLPEGTTLVARATEALDVYDRPGAAFPVRSLDASTILGTGTVLDVIEGPVEGWARVLLPGRPNGSEGWIRAGDVTLYTVSGSLIIDLSDRELSYLEQGEVVLSTDVAVGSPRNPTPTGSFYVTDNVKLSDQNSPWGPAALGLSARSDTITEYNGGDGIIGIHGTNRPGSIGRAASLGCVRVPNDMIIVLQELVRLGTPVEIRP